MHRDTYLEVLSTILENPPERPASRPVFQLAAEVPLGGKPSEETARRCVRIALQWVQDMFRAEFSREAWAGEGFTVEEPGRRAECIAVPEIGLWTLRLELSEPSPSGKNREPTAARTTDISFARRDTGIAFGIRVLGASSSEGNIGIRTARPRIVADLVHQLGLRELRDISDSPRLIETGEDLESLHSLLVDPARTLPVVVLSQPDKRKWSIPVLDYVLDGQYAAEQMLGLAYVVQLPWDMGYQWTELVGKTWSVYLGSVRVYMPFLRFDRDHLSDHPLYLTEKILFWRYDGMLAEQAFTAFLTEKLMSHAASQRIHWDDRLFLTDARARAAELERQRLASTPEITRDPGEEAASLRRELEKVRTAHAREVEALHHKIDELQREAEEYNDDAIRAGKDRDFLMEENARFREQIARLNAELFRYKGYVVNQNGEGISIPEGYEALPAWVARYLPGRLTLHPRSLQGLKSAVYEDVPVVYEVLLVLANQYRNMKLGTGSREDFTAAADRLQLRYGKSISEIRAGEQGDTYFVKYPIGSKTSRCLEMHLRSGGNSRDPRRCLGVYFFWDDEASQVVVGWLPSHLDNRLT